uniref:Uncharacterized protein n=1 Tax=Cacopsylla melanoneura TaxID=428564 RepID=A0A8D8MG25_9HEMI
MEQAFVSPYLLIKLPINRTRITAQLRLCGTDIKLYLGNMDYRWDSEEVCSICNMQKKENLQHFLQECPQYTALRSQHLTEYMRFTNSEIDLTHLLNVQSHDHLNRLFFYVGGALKIRAFIFQE